MIESTLFAAVLKKRRALFDKIEDNYFNITLITKQWKEIERDEVGIHVEFIILFPCRPT